MRKLDIGSDRYTWIAVTDEPGQGGACHEYEVKSHDGDLFAKVYFQNGPIKENGINGCHQEDLLAIVIDRLRGFQSGEYACRENTIALTKIEEAMHWLNARTQERIKRGVEGTNQK